MNTRSSRLMGANNLYDVLTAKARLMPDDVREIQLRVLLALDSAKRSRCPPGLANLLIKHMVMAAAIGSQMRDQSFYKLAQRAYEALYNACMRDTQDLDLTTREYTVIKRTIALYLNHLPKVERGLFEFASNHAQKVLAQK
jgi:hypothetical protein